MNSSIRAISILAFALLVSSMAHAQWKEDGDSAPDDPGRKADGPFGAMMLVTADFSSFLKEWEKPAEPGFVPRIHTTEDTSRGETVTIVVLVSGCAPNASGVCQAVGDFRVTRPDGSVYSEHPGINVWDREPPAPGQLRLAITQLAFEVEPDDPLGRYEIKAEIRDLVAGRSVTLTRTLTISKSKSK